MTQREEKTYQQIITGEKGKMFAEICDKVEKVNKSVSDYKSYIASKLKEKMEEMFV